MRNTLQQLAIVLALWVSAAAVSAMDIRLREEATVRDAVVRLSDVADLTDDAGKGVGDMVVATFAKEQSELVVSLADVRTLLGKREDVNWAHVRLRGYGRCAVYRASAEPVSSTDPAARVVDEERIAGDADVLASPVLANPHVAVSVESPLTVGDHVVAYLQQFAGGEPADLRITFTKSDGELLRRSALEGRWEFEPGTAATLGRIPLTLRRYNAAGDIVEAHRVTAQVARRMLVAVTTRSVSRRQLFTHNDVDIREMYVTDHRLTPVTELSQVIGQPAARMLRSGSLLGVEDIAAAVLVKRGDKVTVRSMVGPLVVRMVGQAVESGGKDELIRVRNEVSRQEFVARVTGPGQVVAVQGDDGTNDEGNEP